MPRTDWKRMREDLAKIADVVGQECGGAGVETKITLGGPPPRIFISLAYPDELHTLPAPAPMRDGEQLEANMRHEETARNFLEASRTVERATKKYGLVFFKNECSFGAADERTFVYGLHSRNYE